MYIHVYIIYICTCIGGFFPKRAFHGGGGLFTKKSFHGETFGRNLSGNILLSPSR